MLPFSHRMAQSRSRSTVREPLEKQTRQPPKPMEWDIDIYLNRMIPRPRLHLLPRPIAHFLGHRTKPIKPIPQYMIWFWSFMGAFIGIMCASQFFRIPHLVELTTTTANPTGSTQSSSTHLIILASLGASAILEYNAVTSPLSQPRNAILGQGISAAIGVSMLRLFQLMDDQDRVDSLRWLAGALAVGVSSAVMGMTKTVHPPAGATSLLAATSPEVGQLGWLLIPVIMGASTILMIVGLLVNNIQRQFPLWWWTELPLAAPEKPDVENGNNQDFSRTKSTDSSFSHKMAASHHIEHKVASRGTAIVITAYDIDVPSHIQLSTEELAFLQALKHKFAKNGSDEGEYEKEQGQGCRPGREELARVDSCESEEIRRPEESHHRNQTRSESFACSENSGRTAV